MKTRSLPQLVVEAGFAAVSQGLRPELRDILPALPHWLDDPEQLARCEAFLLFGLGRRRAARKRLDTLSADDCLPLRALLAPPSEEKIS